MAEPSYSVSVRIRRTIVEEIHVKVPVTDAVVTDEHLDGKKIFAAAVVIGETEELAWRREGEPVVEVHPLQTPPPGVAGAAA
jgi:hypothetical protein